MKSAVLAAGDLDSLQVDVGDTFTTVVKVVIALFLFGIALDTTYDDFRAVARRPWVLVVGLVAQFVLMPVLTVLLVAALDVSGSVALGMLLVVCCPAGNVSNILTHRARGDVALSISLTAASNAVAVVLTPVALATWAGLLPSAEALLRDIELDPWAMALEVVLLVGVPFLAGVLTAHRWPGFAARTSRFVEPAVLVLLLVIVVAGLAGRAGMFLSYVGAVVLAVVAQNLLSLAVGYGVGRAARLEPPGVRAMTFELGVRNTALALVLVLAFFDGLGGMALVVSFWGLWDVASGLLLASWWRRRLPARRSGGAAGGADPQRVVTAAAERRPGRPGWGGRSAPPRRRPGPSRAGRR